MKPLRWKALLRMRGTRSNLAIARGALGRRGSQTKIVNLANTFSRVFNGRVPKISVRHLMQLATGLGYDSMSAFFEDWEDATIAVTRETQATQAYGSAKNLAAAHKSTLTDQFADFLLTPSSPSPIVDTTPAGEHNSLRLRRSDNDAQAQTRRAFFAVLDRLAKAAGHHTAKVTAVAYALDQIRHDFENADPDDPTLVARFDGMFPEETGGGGPAVSGASTRRARRKRR